MLHVFHGEASVLYVIQKKEEEEKKERTSYKTSVRSDSLHLCLLPLHINYLLCIGSDAGKRPLYVPDVA